MGVLPRSWIHDMSRLQFYKGSFPDVTRQDFILAARLNDYSQWYLQSRKPARSCKILDALAEAQQAIYHAKPELKPELTPAAAQADFLPVTRFWISSTQETGLLAHQIPRYLFVDQRTLTISENKIWFMTGHRPYQIFCVDPATLQVVSAFTVPEQFDPPKSAIRNLHYLAVTPEWLAVGLEDRLLLCSRVGNQWRNLDLPPFIYKPRWMNQQLYACALTPFRNLGRPRRSRKARSTDPGFFCRKGAIEYVISSRPESRLRQLWMGNPLGTSCRFVAEPAEL